MRHSRAISRCLVFAFALIGSLVWQTRGLAQASGDQKTLIIVTDFNDKTLSCSADFVRSLMFDPTLSVAELYKNNSAGRVTFSGAVVGPYVIDKSSTDTCNLTELYVAAETSATAAGVAVETYPHRVYVFPPNTCPGGGNGSMGGSPSRSWIYSCNMRGTYVHNLGHNLGMDHAATSGALGESEYGDGSDPMGWASDAFVGFNAPHREQLGWLPLNNVQQVTQDGSYNVAPLGSVGTMTVDPQVLKIAKPDTSEYYYVSLREPVGFDKYIDGMELDRLSIHRYKGDGSATKTYLVARLGDGEVYQDPVNGITVSLVGRTTSSATARAQFNAPSCTPAAPSVTLLPQAQTGVAGTAVSYAVSLTNLDSTGCSATSFAFNRGVPTGWTGTLSSSALTLNPGVTGQVTLTVVSAATASLGTYAATLAATGGGGPHDVSATATYTVQSATDTQPPTAPSRLTSRIRQKQIELSWIASRDNVRVAGYRVYRDGLVVASVPTLSWTDPTVVAGPSYSYTVFAYDAAGNVSAASNTVTVSVGGGGPRGR